MFQGETIKTTISGLPVPVEQITAFKVIFKQMGTVVLEKNLSDCTLDTEHNTIIFRLTEQESLGLDVGTISRSVIFKVGNDRYETKPVKIEVQGTALNEVL